MSVPLRGTAAALLSLFCLLPACVEPSAQGRFERHGMASVWTGALAQQAEHPEQWVPALALLMATPIARHEDQHWSEMLSTDAPVTGGVTSRGDAVAAALTLAALGDVGGEWLRGDEGRAAEALTESFLLTEGLTEIIKRTDRRQRPEGGRSSFPSGHTSYSFCMATWLARSIADAGDEWYYNLGYLAYVPAAYVGINRVEGLRHYPSDVTFGAFLGVALTNLVYNAHYGSARHAGIYTREAAQAWHMESGIDSDGVVFDLVKRF